MSVVDAQLRVYGIENLRIADGSIMPRVTTGNTMAPCIIIGERAAEALRNEQRLETSEVSRSARIWTIACDSSNSTIPEQRRFTPVGFDTELGAEFSKIRPRAAETDTTPYPQRSLVSEM